ncbi:AEC family transporter [Burkholderia sp. Ax-1719]|uniref:AEC family transporter n=1 Tax=Burkholderia sp. Ax-1719 TaxID=2608334 RepID=UPI001421B573|nr:AEC family transporter [Burkholderia sp. Ax-1719]NIE66857.1 AEC family transporter [Burkholderia sp. Ax-1719]
MLSTLGTLLPIFGLVLAGFICRKRNFLGPTAASELNRFVIWLGLPALLFDAVSHSSTSELAQPGFIAAFAIAGAVIFAVVLVAQLLQRRHLADSSIDAICASYPNTAYVGFPLLMLVFGPASLVPTTIAAVLTACVLFGLAVILMEIGMLGETRQGSPLLAVGKSLAKNPLMIAPVLGALFAASGLRMPSSIDSTLRLLGDAASPCALVSLGAFFVDNRKGFGAQGKAARLALVKVFAQPLLTWVIAGPVLHLPSPIREMAVLLSALPTGTGPYMLAEFYRREAAVASQTILYSTLGSLLSLTALLTLLHPARI